jgi:plasmid stabilization system protein ParE
MVSRILIWDDIAKSQLQEIINYIKQDSPKNAITVRKDIVDILKKSLKQPENYSLDKYASPNDGFFRAFEKHKIRVSFYETPNQIIVMRVRHTKMNPRKY